MQDLVRGFQVQMNGQLIDYIFEGSSSAPVGSIIVYAGDIPPMGFLVCDGSSLTKTDYPDLFNAIGYKYGGEGENFNIPDLRGEFLRGAGTNSHTNQGSGGEVGEHQDGTEHIDFLSSTDSNVIFPHTGQPIKSTNFDFRKTIASDKYAGHSIRQSGGVTGIYTSRPTNTSVLFCICVVQQDTVGKTVEITDEVKTNMTYMGKQVYMKTIPCSSGGITNAWNDIEGVGLTDYDTVLYLGGTIAFYNSNFVPMPSYSGDDLRGFISLDIFGGTLSERHDKELLNNVDLILTLYYTKQQ